MSCSHGLHFESIGGCPACECVRLRGLLDRHCHDSAALDCGGAARIDGRSRESNPHARDSRLRERWDAGWAAQDVDERLERAELRIGQLVFERVVLRTERDSWQAMAETLSTKLTGTTTTTAAEAAEGEGDE